MRVRFVGQPFKGNPSVYEILSEALASDWADRLTAVVAWAKRSGLRHLAASLDVFKEKGGIAELILGIDAQGATEEGLRMSIELFDSVHVLNDPSGRTFHLKIYLVRGEQNATLVVGSSNLTAGGVFFNYEGALVVELDFRQEEDVQLLSEVEHFIDTLRADTAITRELTQETLATLLGDPRYGVQQETRVYRRAEGDGKQDGEPEDIDAQVDTRPLPLFGVSTQPKKPGPPLPTARRPPGREETRPPRPPARQPPRAPAPTARIVRRWTKELPASDGQRPPHAGTNPTGNVRLVKAGNPIDWRTYFREEMFGSADWVSETPGSAKEVATVEFRVTVDGRDEGAHSLLVSHDPNREAGQANHMTVLHWGELIPLLASRDFTGYRLVLEELVDGTHHLELTSEEPDPRFI